MEKCDFDASKYMEKCDNIIDNVTYVCLKM